VASAALTAGVIDTAVMARFTQSGTGAVARTAQDKMREVVSVKDFGAVGDGVADDYAAAQLGSSSVASVACGDGVFKLSQTVSMSVPKAFYGNGATTRFEAATGFTGSIFSVSPLSGSDPKGWTISDFEVTNNGSASHCFVLDIAASGKYISKFALSKIVLNNQVSSQFVELINTLPNTDGLFTSVFSDNWSFGGYYLDNVGDSVVLERNTTTGAGRGYYVNQLPTASHILIRDGNCTSEGGILIAGGYNISFDNMQVECPSAFTGSNNAIFSANSPVGSLIFNLRVTNNNINAQTANPSVDCINLEDTQNCLIEGNTLYCHPSSGNHIVIGSNARDTYIGRNSYFSSTTGADIDPRITDNGIGTAGIWKNATITLSGWTAQDPTNEHAPGFFKDIDGSIQLRGRVAGAAATAGDILFTLPVGFRPKSKLYLLHAYGSAAFPSIILQVLPTGEVQILTTGTTGVYLHGLVFSSK
jgi:hypothetical protein